jgi:4-hydroxyphenylpyruvate dioxygenase
MQPTTFENPMGIDGFEFVEFAAPDADARAALRALFQRMGFAAVLRHKTARSPFSARAASTSC